MPDQQSRDDYFDEQWGRLRRWMIVMSLVLSLILAASVIAMILNVESVLN